VVDYQHYAVLERRAPALSTSLRREHLCPHPGADWCLITRTRLPGPAPQRVPVLASTAHGRDIEVVPKLPEPPVEVHLVRLDPGLAEVPLNG
jgi:hypothetical protein